MDNSTHVTFFSNISLWIIILICLIHRHSGETQEEVDGATPTVHQGKSEVICLVWYQSPQLHLATDKGSDVKELKFLLKGENPSTYLPM